MISAYLNFLELLHITVYFHFDQCAVEGSMYSVVPECNICICQFGSVDQLLC